MKAVQEYFVCLWIGCVNTRERNIYVQMICFTLVQNSEIPFFELNRIVKDFVCILLELIHMVKVTKLMCYHVLLLINCEALLCVIN